MFLSVTRIVWFFISLHCSSLIQSHHVAGWGRALDPVHKQILVVALPPPPQGPSSVLHPPLQMPVGRMALQGLTPSLQPWAEVTSNKKPAPLLALVWQPMRGSWAQAFLRSQ